MGAKVDDNGFLRLPWPLVSLLWGIFAGLITFGYNQLQTNSDTRAQLAGMSRDVATLARSVDAQVKRIDLDAQTRYSVSDAARDYGLMNTRLNDHESRIRAIEAARRK